MWQEAFALPCPIFPIFYRVDNLEKGDSPLVEKKMADVVKAVSLFKFNRTVSLQGQYVTSSV